MRSPLVSRRWLAQLNINSPRRACASSVDAVRLCATWSATVLVMVALWRSSCLFIPGSVGGAGGEGGALAVMPGISLRFQNPVSVGVLSSEF